MTGSAGIETFQYLRWMRRPMTILAGGDHLVLFLVAGNAVELAVLGSAVA